MFNSTIETLHPSHRHLQGGVAPLRHDLACHDYLERQKMYAEQKPSLSATTVLKTRLSNASAFMARVIGRVGALTSAGHRVWR